VIDGGLVPVQNAELATGFALVRLEIQFGAIERGIEPEPDNEE